MKFHIYIIALLFLSSSCGENFLDVKRDITQVIPSKIEDYQSLLDKYAVINDKASISLGLVGAAEYTLTDNALTTWRSMIPYEATGYLWDDDIFDGNESTDWNNAYHRILYANMALEVTSINPTAAQQAAWDNVVGGAHFIRGYSYYQLAQLFCKPYNPQTAAQDLGVPLKQSRDVTEKLGRSSVKEVYELIINDLEKAYQLLPEQSASVFRPQKVSAAVLLTRTYMQIGDYVNALKYAEIAYLLPKQLQDYNDLDPAQASFPSNYGATNPEVYFYTAINKPSSTYTDSDISKDIIALYEAGDLRKSIFFKETTDGRLEFKGSFAGLYNIFAGVATGEVYLNYAECLVRNENIEKGNQVLNELREKRFVPAEYQAINKQNATELLQYILDERRRELFFRGFAWEDYRRLNKEGEFTITLKREAFDQVYQLEPNSDRWVWPLPNNEIEINNYQQNPR